MLNVGFSKYPAISSYKLFIPFASFSEELSNKSFASFDFSISPSSPNTVFIVTTANIIKITIVISYAAMLIPLYFKSL